MRLLLVLSLALARTCAAEGPADFLWSEAEARTHRVIELLKAWRPSGLRFEPARPVDLSALAERLEKLRQPIGWSKDAPADLGIFWDERRPTVVGPIRSGGPAERAGIRTGDQFQRIDGHDVAGYEDIARWTKDGPGPFAVTLKGKGTVLLAKSKPDYPPASLMEKIQEEFDALRRSFEELQEQAKGKDASREEIAEEAGRLAEALKDLERRMQEIQEESSSRYRST